MSQLVMEKSGLDHLPNVPLPEGYAIRSYHPGDEAALARVFADATLGVDTTLAVKKDFIGHPAFRPERVFIVEWKGGVVGTASMWTSDDDPDAAYLHMVAVLRAHQGKRLGFALCAAAVRQACREGFSRQRLLTDDWREAAIRLYLDMGYYPLYTARAHPRRWRDLAAKLHRPDLLKTAQRAHISRAGLIVRILRRLRRVLVFVTVI
jgi:mycothiol synthase